jgi:folate-binding protein YgfZ
VTTKAYSLELDGVVADFPGWKIIEVAGCHRERFLVSQVTSDLTALAGGESQLSALLDRTGRLQAFFFLRKATQNVDLLVPEAVAAHCVDRLEAHIIADDVTIRIREVGPLRLLLGPAAVAMADEVSEDEWFPVAGWGGRGFVTWSDDEIELPEMSPDEIAARQVLCGPPVWGQDVQPDQLINETSLLDAAVSLTKGCFLGQETVSKVATHRGAVRAPVLLELAEPDTEPDTEVDELVGEWFGVGDRQRAGQVLAVARWGNRPWLQVSLHREFRVVGRDLVCTFSDGRSSAAEVHPMPALHPPSREEMADRLTVAASTAFAEDRTERALELLERATIVCPSWGDAFESMGVILGRLGRHHEAIDQMHRLLEIDPSSVMAHSNLSLFFNHLGDIEAAERHLALATRVSFGGGAEADPGDLEKSEREAHEADQHRREEMFRMVLEIDPEDALAHFGMGELAVERGRFSEAVDHLEKAIESDPAHSAAILALGAAFEGLDDRERARDHYEAGIEVAAKKGDLATAQKMQERLTALAG